MVAKLGNERCYLIKNYSDDLNIVEREIKTDFEKEMIDVLLSLLTFKFSVRDVAIWYSYYKTETDIDILCKEFGLKYDSVRDVLDKVNSFLLVMEKTDCCYSLDFDSKVRLRVKGLGIDEKKILSMLFNKFLRIMLGDSYEIWEDRIIGKMTYSSIKSKHGCSLNKIFKPIHFVESILKHRYKKLDEVFKQVVVFQKIEK
jgi:hypothetical protein